MAQSTKAAAGMLIYRVVEEVQYLLLQASYEERNWGPPKGHVDPGESETDRMATAIRETEEESGLRVEQYELDNKYGPVELKYNVKGVPKTVHYWLAKLKNPQTPIKLSEEHKDFVWANVDKALTLTFPSTGEAIHKANMYLYSNEKQPCQD